jgi:hypothetical protein
LKKCVIQEIARLPTKKAVLSNLRGENSKFISFWGDVKIFDACGISVGRISVPKGVQNITKYKWLLLPMHNNMELKYVDPRLKLQKLELNNV